MQCLIFKTMFMHASQIAAYRGETIIAANPSLTINSQEFQCPETKKLPLWVTKHDNKKTQAKSASSSASCWSPRARQRTRHAT